jgi:hypothetical protein
VVRSAIWGEDGPRTVAAVGRVLAEAVGLPSGPDVRTPATFAGHLAYERRKRVEFARFLADALLEYDLVIVYLDGDEPWSARTADARARRLLAELPAAAHGVLAESGRTPRGRAVGVIPYYEVEAWLYQNFDALRATVPTDSGVRAFIERYESRRADIDDIVRIKHVLPARNYEGLSVGFPFREVEAAGASFAAALHAIRAALGDLAR